MEKNKFKTTIKCSGCVAKVTPFLNEAVGENKWEVDVNNAAKILSVPTEADRAKVMEAVQKAGFKIEVL